MQALPKEGIVVKIVETYELDALWSNRIYVTIRTTDAIIQGMQ